jgi:hypothetical protein
MPVAVTTPLKADSSQVASARAAAERFGLPFLERGRLPLSALAPPEDALVILGESSSLFLGGSEHRWSPAMGALRVKRLLQGEGATGEPFLEAAGLREADSVLDCTLGLGADALVASAAVGEAGRMVGLEVSPALAVWVAEGLRRYQHPAARRIEVRCADHGQFLRDCAEKSFDVVVIDPMFRYARSQSSLFHLVRGLADPRPLAPEALQRARRVARRWVVIKDGAPGWDLARLGLTPLPSARGAHRLYARALAIP